MFNAQELIDSEIRTILIGSAWRLHYEQTWSGLNFGLWNQPCFCESRNPQVFLTRVVLLTTVYIFEDINWSARPKHCKNSLVFPPTKARNADIKCIFDCRVSSLFEQPCPWVEVLSVPKPKEFVDNKYRMLSQGSNFNFVEILWKLIPESEYEFFLRVETSIF